MVDKDKVALAMRMAALLEYEAEGHGKTDYKHKAAAVLRELAAAFEASKQEAQGGQVPDRWLNVESAMADPLFQRARALMGTENWFQDNALRNVLNYVLAATPATPAQAEQKPALAARGYVAFGAGLYRIQQTKEPGLVVTFRRDGEQAHGVGDRAAEVDLTPIPAEDIIVRLDFTTPAGLDSLEAHLREIRAEHWPAQPERVALGTQAMEVTPEAVALWLEANGYAEVALSIKRFYGIAA